MLSKIKKSTVIIFVILAILANAYFYLTKNNAPKKLPLSLDQVSLIKVGAKCLDFGERSVANDVPIVEFQMVVRLAKKTTTISNCMTDNAYKQNPKWLAYAQPASKIIANKANSTVSENEALTNLSRIDMQNFEPNSNPPYWIK